MRLVFADTFYFLALLNQRDPAHERAIAASKKPLQAFLTTEFVLLELADALSKPPLREEFAAIQEAIKHSHIFRVIPLAKDLFQRGLDLYRERNDKEWQLTDCISFVVMKDEGVEEALTGDRHFEQAGFKALLK